MCPLRAKRYGQSWEANYDKLRCRRASRSMHVKCAGVSPRYTGRPWSTERIIAWNKWKTNKAIKIMFYLHETIINKLVFTMFIWLINFNHVCRCWLEEYPDDIKFLPKYWPILILWWSKSHLHPCIYFKEQYLLHIPNSPSVWYKVSQAVGPLRPTQRLEKTCYR